MSNWSNSSWSTVPQKFIEKQPIYSNDMSCPFCLFSNGYPIFNMRNSPLYCDNCKNTFNQRIIGYKEVLVEK